MQGKYYPLLLSIIIVFHLVNNFIIINNDTVSPVVHAEMYYESSKTLYYVLLNNPGKFPRVLMEVNDIYPPMLCLSPLPFYFIFGVSYQVAAMSVSVLYFTMFIICVYLIGKHLFGPEAGILAAFFSSFFPGIFGLSRMFLMAFPSEALLVLTIYLMLKSDYFNQRGYALLFGLAVGLGMLTKKYFSISLLGIAVAYLALGRKDFTNYKKKSFLNLGIAFFTAAAVAGPWYLSRIGRCILQLQRDKPLAFSHGKAGIDLFTYIGQLYHLQIGIVFFVIFLICLCYLIFKKKLNLFIFAWILWPYLIYSLIVVTRAKSARYTLCILPAVALAIAQGLLEIARFFKGRRGRLIAIRSLFFLMIYGVNNFFSISYLGPMTLGSYSERFFHTGVLRAERPGWDIEGLLEAVLPAGNRDGAISGKHGRKGFIVDGFGASLEITRDLAYKIKSMDMPLRYTFMQFSDEDSRYFLEFLERADFIFLRSEDGSDAPNISTAIEYVPVERVRQFISLFNESYKNQFELVKKISAYPNNEDNQLLVYKRIR
jgi:hypothetical protein